MPINNSSAINAYSLFISVSDSICDTYIKNTDRFLATYRSELGMYRLWIDRAAAWVSRVPINTKEIRIIALNIKRE